MSKDAGGGDGHVPMAARGLERLGTHTGIKDSGAGADLRCAPAPRAGAGAPARGRGQTRGLHHFEDSQRGLDSSPSTRLLPSSHPSSVAQSVTQSWHIANGGHLSSPMPGINSSHHPHLPHHPAAQFGDAGMGDGDERELSEMHGMEELVECMSAEDAAIALRRRKWHKGGGLLPHTQALPHDARLR